MALQTAGFVDDSIDISKFYMVDGQPNPLESTGEDLLNTRTTNIDKPVDLVPRQVNKTNTLQRCSRPATVRTAPLSILFDHEEPTARPLVIKDVATQEELSLVDTVQEPAISLSPSRPDKWRKVGPAVKTKADACSCTRCTVKFLIERFSAIVTARYPHSDLDGND